jgi:hypothetical protein
MDGAFTSAAFKLPNLFHVMTEVTFRDDLLGEEIQQKEQKLHSLLIIIHIQ